MLVDPDETRNWYQRQVLLPTWKIRQVGPGNTEECGSWLPQVATKVAEGLLPSSLGTLFGRFFGRLSGVQCCVRLEVRLPGAKGRKVVSRSHHFRSAEEGAPGGILRLT